MKGGKDDDKERQGAAGRFSGLLRLILVVVVLVGFTALTAITVHGYLQVDEVDMPDLVGMDLEAAYRQVRALDLDVTSFTESVAGAPANSVISQAPEAGAQIRRGRSVSLGVNQPREAARTPDLRAEEESSATRRLADMGIPIEQVSYVYSDEPAGRVVQQQPAPGEALDTGQGMALVVSRGPEVEREEVPDVSGMSVRAARERLHEAGFRRVELIPTGTSFIRAGTVRDQSPSAGNTVPVSTPVSLYYLLSSSDVVRVPDLSGMTVQRAQVALRASGLELGWVNYVEDEAQEAGIVSFQPEGHTLPGTPVTVTVNGAAEGDNLVLEDDRRADLRDELDRLAGGLLRDADRDGERLGDDELAEGAREVPFRFDPSAYGLPANQTFDFRLEVSDEEGERTLIERRLRPGDTIDTLVVLYDPAMLHIYINDSLFSAWSP